MSTLGAEIAAARLMAPFFGSSTIIWANTIAVVLLALSAGYKLGGVLADRRPDAELAARARAGRQRAAGGRAVHRAPVPVAERARVRRAVGGRVHGVAVRDARAGRGAAAAARRGVAVGDAAAARDGRGGRRRSPGGCTRSRRSARSSACSSSRCGRSRRSAPSARSSCSPRCPRWSPRSASAAARCSCPLALVAALRAAAGDDEAGRRRARVLFETETPYQYARVVERPDGTRRLELNEGQAIHSLWRPGTVLTGGYWDGFLVLPFATGSGKPPARIAALGTAGGTVPRAYAHYFPDTRIDAVDIDPELFAIGRRYFGLERAAAAARDRRGRAAVPAPDRRALRLDLRRRLPPALHPVLPDHARVLRARRATGCSPGGSVIINIGHPRRLAGARAGAERDDGRGVRARRARPDPAAELARDRLRRAADARTRCATRRCRASCSRWRSRAPGGSRRRCAAGTCSPTTARRSSG